jgi:hypothetical protein
MFVPCFWSPLFRSLAPFQSLPSGSVQVGLGQRLKAHRAHSDVRSERDLSRRRPTAQPPESWGLPPSGFGRVTTSDSRPLPPSVLCQPIYRRRAGGLIPVGSWGLLPPDGRIPSEWLSAWRGCHSEPALQRRNEFSRLSFLKSVFNLALLSPPEEGLCVDVSDLSKFCFERFPLKSLPRDKQPDV